MGSADRALMLAARTLVLDRAGAEVVGMLRSAGIEPVLLKGAILARWLYRDELRPYGDIDLLVDPARAVQAQAVLRGLGFEPWPQEVSPHAHPWLRRSDGAEIDLHLMLFGPKCSPQRCWNELQGWLEWTELASVPVLTLSPPARLLQVVLHASQHVDAAKPLEDLRRALKQVPGPVWREAETLADRIDALHRMENGLGLVEEGAQMIERLPLVRAARIADRAHAPLAVAFARLEQAPGMVAKLRALRVALALPDQLEVDESMKAGRAQRLRARIRQLLWLPVRVPKTLWARRAQRVSSRP
jgi:hypothetical protein